MAGRPVPEARCSAPPFSSIGRTHPARGLPMVELEIELAWPTVGLPYRRPSASCAQPPAVHLAPSVGAIAIAPSTKRKAFFISEKSITR
jgi:hypothetical protein